MTISYPTGENFASDFPEDSDKSKANTFDIRDHLDKLQPGKEKNKYICPVCGGQNLGIDPKTGKYRCFTSECASADIREAIRPLAEFLAERKGEQPARQVKKPRVKKKEYPPAPIPLGAKLLRLPAPGQSPQPEQLAKDAPKRIRRDAVQITYEYSPTQNVVRYQWPDATKPKGRDKTFSQFHLDPDGKKVWTKGDAPWPAYRIDEVVELLKTIPDGEPVVIPILEGEDNVELARRIRLAALTLQGSNWGDPEIQKMLEALRATGKNVSIAVIGDNDDTGIKKGKSVWLVARHLQFPCLIIDPTAIDVDIPEKGDIREFLEVMEADEFLLRVEAEIFKAANPLTSNISLTSHPRTCECVVCLSFFR
jgi:putative DNA primase/helicase